MRELSVAALAKLAQTLGTEPVIVIQVQWSTNGNLFTYGDIDAPGVDGKILEVGGLENVITISGVSQGTTGDSQELSFTLDDTNGAIKAILDTNDVHKRPVWVYQWFPDLPFADRFLLFKGEVSSPIEWIEGERTVSFNVINKIEDAEVGFSIEEGDFPYAPDELIGVPWPLVFGTCVHVPALKVVEPFQGILQTGFGIHDFTLEGRLEQLEKLCCPQVFSHQEYQFSGGSPITGVANATLVNVFRPDAGCVCKIKSTREEWIDLLAQQRSYEFATIEVINGEIFPQGKLITLDICGSRVRGRFNGTTFSVQEYIHPQRETYEVPPVMNYNCIHAASANFGGPTTTPPAPPSQVIDCNAPDIDKDRAELGWDYLATFPIADFFWAEPGCRVFLVQDECIVYIVNLLPSTIHRVAAWRTFDTGERALVTVPSSLYIRRLTNYNGYVVTEIVFTKLLSRRGEGWEDNLYVSQQSSIGPNTVDILSYLINKYTTFDVDSASFTAVRAKIDKYPSSFPLLERKNILEVLREIAFQARCALILRDDTFYILYLSEEPTSDFTIDEDDVIAKSFTLTHTETEELVTKFTAEWKVDYAVESKNKVILRYNVKKYGTQERVFDFYIYNILSLVQKSATFWLIRMANTWRKVLLSTPLTKLEAEVFDIATVTLPDFASTPVKCIVEQATYNSDSHEIDFVFWTPVRSGERTQYNFAWPAQIAVTFLWPERADLLVGNAGGSGPNINVRAPAGHVLSASPPADFNVNIEDLTCTLNKFATDILGKCRRDHGDKKPTDIDDVKPTPKIPGEEETDVPTSKNPIGDKSPAIKALEGQINKGVADQQTQTQLGGSGGGGVPTGGGGGGGGDEPGPYDELPDEPEDMTCKTYVQYRTFTSVGSVITDMGISSTPGETGPLASSPPATGDELVRMWFDSKEAADNIYDYLLSIQHADATVGEPHIIAGTVVNSTVNWTIDCEEPENASMVAVKKPETDFDWEAQVTDALENGF